MVVIQDKSLKYWRKAVKELREYLLKAPDSQLDAAVKPLIEKWDEDPTPLQILEPLDLCINGSLASGFVVAALQAVYDVQCKKMNTTHEEVVKQASWREPPPPPPVEEKKDPSAGLFTVECDGCKTVFPAENMKCSCGATKGELRLDVPVFLARVYSLVEDEDKPNSAGLDIVFDVFWNLYSKWDIMNDIMSQVDVNRLNETLMVGFMVQTFKYIKKVPAHLGFCDRAAVRMKELGLDDKRIHDLVDRYRDTGDYWKNMESLGAPTWLTGPKPE